MNIKPCVKCGKPLRADATYCKACGHTMGGEDTINRASTSHTTRRSGRYPSRPYSSRGPSRNRDTRRTGTRPTIPSAQKSIPPASPHRAGHYSGLHPEDQPYQSSFVAALRPPTPTILSPSPLTYPLERVLAPTNPNAIWTPEAERQALDSRDHLSHEEDVEQDESLPPPAPLPASSYPN